MVNGTDIVRASRERAMEKAEAERLAAEEARELHQLHEQVRAEQRSGELAELLSQCSDAMAQHIRLEAAKDVLRNPALYGAQKQLMMDERALEYARYAVLGKA